MNFKGVENNSLIKEIGPLFRRHGDSGWQINVKLVPSQKKQYFRVSQLPILARRRVINATETPRSAGYPSSVVIENAQRWNAEPINACPIPAVKRQEDSEEWCFVFRYNGTQYYLPQLELARVLFFHQAYLARLSMIQGGLAEEFDIQRTNNDGKTQINILPTCTLPQQARKDNGLMGVLTWILLDPDVRQSFESIARYQLQDGDDQDKHREWHFQFDPPQLAGAKLALRGHYEKERNAFFVYEVHGLANLPAHCPADVEIVDPKLTEGKTDQRRVVPPSPSSAPMVRIDDGGVPDSDRRETRVQAPKVAFEFATPVTPTRRGTGRRRAGGSDRLNGDGPDSPGNTGLDVSTNEASILGTLPPADYDALEDQSDDSHLYADKFEAFDAMVNQLLRMPGCHGIHREIRKLPHVNGYSKHLLKDNTPRCMAYHRIKKNGSVYELLEVDTSDNSKPLSTLLLLHKNQPFGSELNIREWEIELLKNSLTWPKKWIKSNYGSGFRGITHPQVSSVAETLLEEKVIIRWAERVYEKMSMNLTS